MTSIYKILWIVRKCAYIDYGESLTNPSWRPNDRKDLD